MRCRVAFTLIELLVALVLVDCGLLAIAGTGATVARQVGSSARRTTAVTTALSRVERLLATACAGDVDGASGAEPGLAERWRARIDAARIAREIVVTVDYADGARRRTIELRSRGRC